ncbi:precorrin-2 C(20)-methyltransferase [Nocardia cyriacigeorgica]|jgi:precorrin-2 C20-methyltransferase / precorrin-3B C17-methyltransferase|uniref:precorrin-2 C(20)-methyltransferase n=1 Tax=Nocardia cyriacigeorgica TaxID=135487 RepID=UPI0002DCC486|nr:precorrin-2 C(20)-methyltransferase [Nocardia cyriacigeorgica]AVH23346.1 precorrin-2 C(20)-methyltransferase [Nocardia cyriacigeorgica]MBF6497264.1 precorrin-2 C(20)-methyltransferase [Nocardia cyriacigeorgica]PPJ10226.1 precorrin-2 C(20)-methyltransferase [Nocardia cyriacigeorgica]TLF54401.1 precorrin-2 C(20)-methyltransferase [Nocardia cyriacigeorgica]
MSAPGKLWGIGLGPGDPELVTVKAARIIGAADVIAFHSARHGRSISRGIAEPYMRPGQLEEHLVYPVTTETTDHPGGYQGAIDEFYEQAAERLADHLAAGRSVALLAAGDPLFYSSYMHMHRRLAGRFEAEIIPGITSVSAASAALGTPLVEGEQVLTVLPGTMPVDELTERLRDADAAAVMKLGRTYPAVRQALSEAGKLGDAYYVERASTGRERVLPAADVADDEVPYFAITIVPGPEPTTPLRLSASPENRSDARHPAGDVGVGAADAAIRPAPGDGTLDSRSAATTTAVPAENTPDAEGAPLDPCTPVDRPAETGDVVVVGLGPGATVWTTPEVERALAEATDLIGYTTYVDRVPVRPGQRRHASDNRVESERAAMALDLAKNGARVAVVSSGDPGVFAMAAAVLEESADPQWKGVPVRVLPGVTAANAVASRVGAPLGHDYAMISLSDRLKPWDVVARRLSAAAAADMAIAIYNPASSQRTWQVAAMRELLLEHRTPLTPVVIGRDVGGPTETVRVVSLGDLEPSEVDMRTLLIIGASTTAVVETEDGPRVYTSRRYQV